MEDELTLSLDGKTLGNLRVVDLKQELEKRGLSKSGSKKDLVKRLKQQLEFEKLCGDRKSTGDCDLKKELDAATEQNEFVQRYLAQQQKIFAEQKEVKRLVELEEIQKKSEEKESCASPQTEDNASTDESGTEEDEASDSESSDKKGVKIKTTENDVEEGKVVKSKANENDVAEKVIYGNKILRTETGRRNKEDITADIKHAEESKSDKIVLIINKTVSDAADKSRVDRTRAIVKNKTDENSAIVKNEPFSTDVVFESEAEKTDAAAESKAADSVILGSEANKSDAAADSEAADSAALESAAHKNDAAAESKAADNVILGSEADKSDAAADSEAADSAALESAAHKNDTAAESKAADNATVETEADKNDTADNATVKNEADKNDAAVECKAPDSAISENEATGNAVLENKANKSASLVDIKTDRSSDNSNAFRKSITTKSVVVEEKEVDEISKVSESETDKSNLLKLTKLDQKDEVVKIEAEITSEIESQKKIELSEVQIPVDRSVKEREVTKETTEIPSSNTQTIKVSSSPSFNQNTIPSQEENVEQIHQTNADNAISSVKTSVAGASSEEKLTSMDPSVPYSLSEIQLPESPGSIMKPSGKTVSKKDVLPPQPQTLRKEEVGDSQNASSDSEVQTNGVNSVIKSKDKPSKNKLVSDSLSSNVKDKPSSRELKSSSPKPDKKETSIKEGKNDTELVKDTEMKISKIEPKHEQSRKASLDEPASSDSEDKSSKKVKYVKELNSCSDKESKSEDSSSDDSSQSDSDRNRRRSTRIVSPKQSRERKRRTSSSSTGSQSSQSRESSPEKVSNSEIDRSRSSVSSDIREPASIARKCSPKKILPSVTEEKSVPIPSDPPRKKLRINRNNVVIPPPDEAIKISSDKSTKVSADKSIKISSDKSTKISSDKSDKVSSDKSVKVTPEKSVEISHEKSEKISPEKPVKTSDRKSIISPDKSPTNDKHSDPESPMEESSEPVEREMGEIIETLPEVKYETRKLNFPGRKLNRKSTDELPSEEPKSKKSKWGRFASSQRSSQTINISTDSLKNWFPDFKLVNEPSSVSELTPEDTPPIKEEKRLLFPSTLESETEVKQPTTLNTLHENDEPPSKENTEASGPVSKVVFIQNLVRPFTLLQLKELLRQTGSLIEEEFWIDKIKSKCFATYETEEEAIKTRSALNGTRWPSSNPKILSVEFSTEEELELYRSGADVPKPVLESLPPVQDTYEPKAPQLVSDHRKRERETEKRKDRERFRPNAPIREWDKDKVLQESPGRETAGKDLGFRVSEKKDKKDIKKRPNEDTPAKLLDDLFQKTKSVPCIYWLPLTEIQVTERAEANRIRRAERDKRLQQREQEESEHRNKRPRSDHKTRELESRRSSTRSRSPASRRR